MLLCIYIIPALILLLAILSCLHRGAPFSEVKIPVVAALTPGLNIIVAAYFLYYFFKIVFTRS